MNGLILNRTDMILKTVEKTKQTNKTEHGTLEDKYNGNGRGDGTYIPTFASSLLLISSESESENIKTVRNVLVSKDCQR